MSPSRLQTTLVWATTLLATVLPAPVPFAAAAALPNLRILTLGDSITKGSGSTHNNGYRDYLRTKLGAEGIKVDMIGTLRNGVMQDNNHEGHSGDDLADIQNFWQKPTAAKPNLVLIHAGTNNMDLEIDLDIAPQLYEGILDGILKQSPYTTILVAPVIWANDARMQRNTDAFNQKLRALVQRKQQAGKHILLTPVGIASAADLSDKKHPNNSGYQKFANAWFSGILDAQARGWLQLPATIDQSQYPGVGLGWNR